MSNEPVYSAEHRKQFIAAVQAELDHAYAKHGALPWSRHEFFGVLREEVDELWDDIKADAPTENIIEEMTQIAAMCLRYAETVDRYRGPHPLPLPTRAALSPPQPVAGWPSPSNTVRIDMEGPERHIGSWNPTTPPPGVSK